VVEGDRAADLRLGELQVLGDAGQGLLGDLAESGLDVADDVQQDRRVLGMLENDVFHMRHV